ncbi:unnamed protein product [Mytilus coruscus]|uniref:Reverse transcriptase domain-containing protein n=1 Tax=Mytilus coruscus TaxID=42192 RepID=A0A6J8B261_MYTCO|nr:unnamed protein product [Mytilus coruscus]
MCFGPTCAPQIFTKIVSVVAAYLRAQNLRMVVYLDDWIIVNQDQNQLILDREKCLNLIVSLGFIVNKEKSNLIPSQSVTYLGGVFHLEKGLIFPTLERIEKLQMLIQNMQTVKTVALDFLRILGVMASCIQLIPKARLYMRPIQLHLLSFWNPICKDMTVEIPFTQHLKSHLSWWTNAVNTLKGRSLVSQISTVTVTTDASKSRFWGLCWETNFPRGMEFTPERVAYQLLRNKSSLFDNKTFSESVKEQIGSDQERQHKCCSVYKSPGRDKIDQSLSVNLGIMEDGHSEQHGFEGSPYHWQEQCSSRSVESHQNTSNRVDFKQDNCWSNFSSVGCSSDRPFCFMGEQANRSILYRDTPSQCTSIGCIDNTMGEHVCLCFPSDLSDTEDIKVYEAVPLSDYLNSTSMAQEILVSRNSPVINSASYQTTTLGEFVDSTQSQDMPSESSNVEFSRMAPIDRNFKAGGFSESARNLLNASWRKGTQRDYIAKFEKYSSWCTGKQIDPYSATLSQIADFLAPLFESGLQYRTISGYRSMLSAVLSPIDNYLVGQHPYISRLIKGVFHSRPPKTNLLPEWDLEIVLKALENEPFEPLCEASLKFITFKTVFLIAITTFRRCSDLQSLRIDKASMKVQEKV